MSADTKIDSGRDHPAIVLLYFGGGLILLALGLALVFAGTRPRTQWSDTVPFELLAGVLLAPVGVLSLIGAVAIRGHWRYRTLFRALPFIWLLGLPALVVAGLWLVTRLA